MSSLPIRLVASNRDQHLRREATGLSFTKSAPGGHAFARVRVNVSLQRWAQLGPNDRIYVYDPATGEALFDGYTGNPTPSRDINEGFEVSADGGRALAADDRRSLIYIDRDQEQWVRNAHPGQGQSSRTEWGPSPSSSSATNGMVLGFQPGQPIGTGSLAEMGYFGLYGAQMEVGAVALDYACGTTDAAYEGRLLWAPPLGWVAFAVNVAGGSLSHYAGDGTLPTGAEGIALNLIRTGGATNVADDDHWLHHTNLRILGRRMLTDGTLVTGAIADDHVLASEVVADLVGRMLPFIDPGLASIAATTQPIEQLAYRTPVTALTVLDELALYEPDMVWEIGASSPAGHAFTYRPWPTEARYEVSYADGWQARGTDVDLCNRVWVNWTENDGKPASVLVSSSVPELDEAGRIRHADPVNLPAGRGSATNAQSIGEQVLAAKAELARSATVAVRRRVFDRDTSTWVPPYRIEPGYLAVVRETGDQLRITELSYDDDQQTATLTLGQPQLTLDQRLARLARIS